MKIQDVGIAGTLESSDITVRIENNDGKGIAIELKSTVENQFGNQIRKVIKETLTELGVQDVAVHAVDKGALDCTIRSRIVTAVSRATKKNCFPWEEGK
jgi:citrate lyase subunit gamma (acyl carrier protein)